MSHITIPTPTMMTYMTLLMTLHLVFQAQFKTTLLEGDYVPAKGVPVMDQQNRKYKDPPQISFDVKRHLWHATWTQFDSYKSKLKEDHSVIYYSQSAEGKAWSHSKQLNYFLGDCLDGDSTVKGAMPCVGKNAEIYVSWAGPKGLVFQRSLDSGKTWLNEEKIVNAIPKGWACKIDHINTNGLPAIACDLSSGEFSGRVYICWSDEKNGEKNKDVFLVYSDNKGETWTEPILVTYRPNHKEQFKPCIKVDSLSGFVYILYFDKQNYLHGHETDLTLALSKNGGLKFDYFKVNKHSFSFNSNYTELLNEKEMKARWIQADGLKRFAMFEVLFNDSSLSEYNANEYGKEIQLERSYKYNDKLSIEFSIPKNAMLHVALTKPLEPGYEKTVLKNKRTFAGKNKIELDFKQLGLKKGNYILTFYYNDRNSFVWITDD